MEPNNKNIFVLVHGAYHGGWCWEGVAKELENKGRRVYAPTLTGLSERRSSYSSKISLDTHVKDIVKFVQDYDLLNIHLVGWSYGGMVIAGVLGAIPERVSAMTFLDAHLPEHGHSAASYLRGIDRFLLKCAAAFGKGLPPPRPKSWGLELELAERIGSKLSKQPARTFTQPVTTPEPWPEGVSYTYIRCLGYAGSVFDQFYIKAQKDTRFRTAEIEAGHGAVHTHPVEVANAIIGF